MAERPDTTRPRIRTSNIVPPVIAVAAGLALVLVRFGGAVVDPGRVDWLLSRHDPAAYFLVWDYFRAEPWSFPLGQVTGYLFPLGTSLPLADGLPLFAYPFKLLAPVLPEVFQYFGLWHVLCALLQAWFGYRVASHVVPHAAGRTLGAVLLLLAPAFLQREGHIALSGHWLILAAIDLYLRDANRDRPPSMRRWCLLLAAAALVHPYLVAMVMLVLLGSVLLPAPGGWWTWLRRAGLVGAAVVTIGGVWWVAGNLEGLSAERVQAPGFGHYSTNVNATINPMGYGTLLSSLPRGRGQYEGYAYLGVGWLAITAVAAVAVIAWPAFRRRARRHRGLIVLMAVAFLYALSNKIMCNETVIAQYVWPPFLDQVSGVFRCSGRFVWPVLYVSMAGGLAFVGAVRPRGLAVAILGAALVVQAIDLRPLVLQRDHFASMEFETRLSDANWDVAANSAEGITTVPPFRFSLMQKADYREFCWLGTRHEIPTTAGYAARMSPAARALADSMAAAIVAGRADPRHLYVCQRSSFPGVLAGLGDRFTGAQWDGYFVCHPRQWPVEPRHRYEVESGREFAAYLAGHHDRIVLLAARDEASAGLTDDQRQALLEVGLGPELAYRSSAAAIIVHGEPVWHEVAPDRRVEISLAVGDSLGEFRAVRSLTLVSAGFETGNRATIHVDGEEVTFDARGFNVAVLDDDQRLVEAAWFDTHRGRDGVVIRRVEPGASRTPAAAGPAGR